MAIETSARLPPHVAIRQEIQKRRSSPAVQLSGLTPVLDMLDAYIVATSAELHDLRARLRDLEKAVVG